MRTHEPCQERNALQPDRRMKINSSNLFFPISKENSLLNIELHGLRLVGIFVDNSIPHCSAEP